MTKKHFAALITGSLLLSGCDFAPHYIRPAMPVAPTLPTVGKGTGGAEQVDTHAAADIAWRDFFTDPRLRSLIELGLANNRDLRVAVGRVEQARAQYHVQRADLLPTITVGADASFQKAPLPQGPANLAGRADIYSANVGTASWEIDLFGRIRDLNKAALERYFASQDARDAAQTALVAEIATAWLVLAADQEQLRIDRNTGAAFKATVDLTEARLTAGSGSELEVRQARTSYDRARSDVANLTSLVAQDQNALTLLVGAELPVEALPADLPPDGATLATLPAGLSSDVLMRRPDIAGAERELRAANADIGAARAAFFPRLSLTAAFGTLSMGLSNLFTSGSQAWSVAPSAIVPIFDFGRNQANLKGSKAAQEIALAQYEKAIQSGFREVADALARRGTIGDQLEAQQALRDNAAHAFQLSDARYRFGTDSFLTTLDSQRALYAAEQSLIATRLVRETNLVELYRGLGGGLK